MEIKEILHFQSRSDFRQWLSENHSTAAVCWVALKKGKASATAKLEMADAQTEVADGKPNLAYLDAVEEALCFGWIDSTQKTHDGTTIQRFSPRKKGSPWSELNKARCRRLERLGLMTEAGRKALPDMSSDMKIDPDILSAFRANPQAWENFRRFPALYQRVRIDTIQRDKHKGMETFHKRLRRLLEASAAGQMFGEWNDSGRLTE
ncbi:MAG: YdeI/OmpD-associated family protein [Bacteroidales bacterium]|nr:YdeI/OmpD-associated family protein [Bacteroidales bacterium]